MLFKEVTENYQLDRIVPFFQPIMDLRNQRVWRYECLARLVTPSQQVFLPSDFLYLIERHNHISRLTETMFTQSAQYFKEKSIPWNINLDSADLMNHELIHLLSAQLKDYPNPQRVSVEVSADVANKHFCALQRFIDIASQCGIGVFIDNLGKSPGNIRKLLSLPLRGVKLDGGLFQHLAQQSDVREFVLNVCDISNERHIAIVAEHVSDETILEEVRKLPIYYAQGFAFSKPVRQLSVQ